MNWGGVGLHHCRGVISHGGLIGHGGMIGHGGGGMVLDNAAGGVRGDNGGGVFDHWHYGMHDSWGNQDGRVRSGSGVGNHAQGNNLETEIKLNLMWEIVCRKKFLLIIEKRKEQIYLYTLSN